MHRRVGEGKQDETCSRNVCKIIFHGPQNLKITESKLKSNNEAKNFWLKTVSSFSLLQSNYIGTRIAKAKTDILLIRLNIVYKTAPIVKVGLSKSKKTPIVTYGMLLFHLERHNLRRLERFWKKTVTDYSFLKK